jgi:hypothetical protein
VFLLLDGHVGESQNVRPEGIGGTVGRARRRRRWGVEDCGMGKGTGSRQRGGV